MDKKLDRMREWMRQENLTSLLVEKQPNFHWLTGGGRGFIGLNTEAAVVSLLVTAADIFLLSSNIESERVKTEEMRDEITVLEYPWYDEGERVELLRRMGGERCGTDTGYAARFMDWRTELDDGQKEFYRSISPQVASVLEEEMRRLQPGVSELELAGRISSRLWAMDVEPVTLLVGFDERQLAWRHPLPTANTLQKHALAAVAVRARGQFVSATRQVSLGEVPSVLHKNQAAAMGVDADAINATRPGRTMGELFGILADSYERHGFPGEWHHHHQGGLTGYTSREVKAAPGGAFVVRANQAYAWNPTVQGAKSEDTILVGEEGNVILTHTGNWQYETVCGLKRPVILPI